VSVDFSILTDRRENLTGQRFGRYTVVGPHDIVRNIMRWVCRCDCGSEKVVWGNGLKHGNVVSCGCFHKQRVSEIGKRKADRLIGRRFGRLMVLARVGSHLRKALWLCKCDCGKEAKVPTGALKSGNSLSCGCLQKETMHRIRWREDLSMEERELGRNRDALPETNLWRKAVYSRDSYTCQACGCARSGSLIAHHKNCWADFPSLRFVLDNGVTCCTKCHKSFHSGYGYGRNTESQWTNFMQSREGAV
jgi:hypothetical protein